MKRYLLGLCWLLLPSLLSAAQSSPVVHHDLKVQISPDNATLRVRDDIRLPGEVQRFEFLLHQALTPTSMTEGASIQALGSYPGRVPTWHYRVQFERPSRTLSLEYSGRIEHQLQTRSQNYAGGRVSSPGLISTEGVVLSAASAWFPVIEDRLVSFRLHPTLPKGWLAVSQGSPGPEASSWQELQPQDDIYLIAGPYSRYRQQGTGAAAEVYLRSPDPALAERYLQATDQYLKLYSQLIGPYPYAKFALVENFWESGYGMPSFTLLGSRVIRLPFILHSSFPHEILHNWWGNGVYVDYLSGNWSEGLTSYLADHLIQEQQGAGSAYRRNTLQRYSDFVLEGKDFPLSQFRGHHGDVSQAVGYGKMLMFLHMLRLELGDQAFVQGIRRFYQDNLFRTASFADLRSALETSSGKPLGQAFEQWTTTTGAPALSLESTKVTQTETGYRLQLRLRQTQTEPVFSLQIPLFVLLAGDSSPVEHRLTMNSRVLTQDIVLPRRPLRLSVDPRFDLFRKPDPSELPTSLGRIFGAEQLTIVLPGQAPDRLKAAYKQLADAWSERQPTIQIRWDDSTKPLPDDTEIWLFGRENRFLDQFSRLLQEKPVSVQSELLTLHGKNYGLDDHSFTLTARAGEQNSTTLGLLVVASPETIPRLARKLPHYGKYSYVVFQGEEAVNVEKGQWQVSESALSIIVTPNEHAPPLRVPELPPLSAAAREPVSHPRN